VITALPEGCSGGPAEAGDVIAFVAQGRAWAAAPDGSHVACLFRTEERGPGTFAWGPLADRVALSGLAVVGVGVGSDVDRTAGDFDPSVLSWGRPTGKAIVYVGAGDTTLEKAYVGNSRVDDVTPLDDSTYHDVVYHPSGLAIAFVADGPQGSAIWMSSNDGSDPKRLIWSKSGSVFGPLAFDLTGSNLFYGARLVNGTWTLNVVDIENGHVHMGLWTGDRDIERIVPTPDEAGGPALLTLGTGCADRTAVATIEGETGDRTLLPDAAGPTSVVGWTETGAVVAEGDCDGPMRLWSSPSPGGLLRTFVAGVDRAALRVPDPVPPPALPDIGVTGGFA
jgi:hypothetical protein